MFDILYQLLFNVIDLLKWYIPILIVFSFIGGLIKGGK